MVWNQNISKEIFNKKYQLHNEKDEEEVFRLIAKEISSKEKEFIRKNVEDQFYKMMSKGYFIPAGRILANARPDSPLKNYNNCFVIDIQDSMESITLALKEYMTILKQGGGVGFNISNLRPRNTPLSTGGFSSGPLSFLEIFDQASKTIEVGGQRRGASICIMNIDHPDIEEFITFKRGDENKKLTQFNISVGITNDFIIAVENNDKWELKWNNKVYKTVKAKDLYNLLIKNAYLYNDPGIFNLDTVNYFNNGHYMYNIKSPNPCLTGDTLIAVADGRNAVTIEQLSKEGKFPVYSGRSNKSKNQNSHSTFKTEIKDAIAFESGTKEIIEVLLSDGTSFRCTPEHLIATKDGRWIKAKDSEGEFLEKFYTFSNNDSKKNYRHINSKSNGYARQYRMIYEFYKKDVYDGKKYTIDHKDNNASNDSIDNLILLSKKEHDKKTKENRMGDKNPIHRMNADYRKWINRKRNINANATRYGWSEERKKEAMDKFLQENPKPDVVSNNIYLDHQVYVDSIYWTGEIENVYDLNVADNYNFYIITDGDENYRNSCGILVHNCGEQPLPSYGVCNLGAIDLSKSIVQNAFHDNAYIDYCILDSVTRLSVRFLDNVIDVTDYPLEKIKNQQLGERRIGLGITGLGDMLAMLKVPYGSKQSQTVVEQVFKTIRDCAYDESVELAKEKGTFPNYKDAILESAFIKNLDNNLQEKIKKHGLRNISVLTVAPTGTISFSIGQNCSSGIEPIFALEYDRHIRMNNNETKKEKVYDYAWLKYLEFIEKNCPEGSSSEIIDKYYDIDETGGRIIIPEFFKTALEIDPYDHIEIQSIAQKYIDSSISKTINIPENYSKEDYSKLFLTAYKKGLKGITSFRIGSMKGVLDIDEKKDNRPKYIERADAPKRPESLPCDIHEISVNKERHIVLIGKLQGTLYEIFVTNDPGNEIEKIGKKEGIIRKKSKGQYQLLVENGKERVIFDNISERFDNIYASLSRFISMGLRHGVNLQFIVNQLQKDKNFLGFERAVSRVLKKYIKDGEKVLSSEKCENCKEGLIYREGCVSCPSCGWSKCG